MYIEGARKPEQTIRYELPFKSLELMIQDLEFECQVIGSGSGNSGNCQIISKIERELPVHWRTKKVRGTIRYKSGPRTRVRLSDCISVEYGRLVHWRSKKDKKKSWGMNYPSNRSSFWLRWLSDYIKNWTWAIWSHQSNNFEPIQTKAPHHSNYWSPPNPSLKCLFSKVLIKSTRVLTMR